MSAVCVLTSVFGAVVAIAADAPVTLPSGLEVRAWDTVAEAPLYRARYLAPALAGGEANFGALAEDMAWLCAEEALPRFRGEGAEPSRIVITLMSEPVEFGVMTPEVAQFFESYAIEGPLCIWEAF